MIQSEVLKKVINILEKVRTPYMVTGAMAVNYYGKMRTTHDIDIIIEINSFKKERFVKEFQKEFYISDEAIIDAIQRRSSFNLIHNESCLKIDFWMVKNNEFSKLEFQRRKPRDIFNQQVFLITAEDLIITKLNWYKKSESEKHFEDVLGIYQIQKGNLDEKYIIKWTAKQGTLDLWQKIKELST